jgi:hypothetical protein
MITYHRCKAHLSAPDTYDLDQPVVMAEAILSLTNCLLWLERWFDTDKEILNAMDATTLADHVRQHERIKAALERVGAKP